HLINVPREGRPQFVMWTEHLFGCLEHVLGTACRVIDDSDQHGLGERDTEQPRHFSVGGRLFNSAQLLFAKARATQYVALSAAATSRVDQLALDEGMRLRIAPSRHKIFGGQFGHASLIHNEKKTYKRPRPLSQPRAVG